MPSPISYLGLVRKQLILYKEGHGNLIEKLFMMAMPTSFPLASKAKILHYYLYHQEKSMRTKFKF